jgi:hypothetical protein
MTTKKSSGDEQPRWALGFFCAVLIVASLIALFIPGIQWIGGAILGLFFVAISWRMQRGYSIAVFFRRDSWRR